MAYSVDQAPELYIVIRAESFPRGTAVNNQLIRIFCDVRIEIVHQHSHGGLLMPAFATQFIAARRMNHSFPAHKLSNAPARIFSASRAMSPDNDRSPVSRDATCLTSSNARSTPLPARNGRRYSSASAPASNSIAKRFSAKSRIDRNLSALVIPIETWSSLPPEVVTLSVLAG